MISKMKPVSEGGSRLAIVFNGSPLFTGTAGSGESEIRRWIIENDWLEAIVALPDQLFYNTGISTYFWIVTNRKAPERRGLVQLVDARESWTKMRKSLGDKRKEISAEQIEEITRLYGDFTEGERVKIFPNGAFGFLRITVERPLRLRWEVTEGTLAAVAEAKQVAKLPEATRTALLTVLRGRAGERWKTEKAASRALAADLLHVAVNGSVTKAVMSALGVRDEEALPVTDRQGTSEPDPDLRDYENVPLPAVSVQWEEDVTARLTQPRYRKAIGDYMSAEVLPYVPDARVDHEKTKVGYEIPLTRHFYEYVPPRPVEEIDAEIKALETEIQKLLAEVAG
jgi:type I restriction enzyme M protein